MSSNDPARRALIALNNDIWNPLWTTVTCRTQHVPGTVMHDYMGKKNGEDSIVDFGITPAANGKGYGFWAPAGVDGRITFPKLSCTQSFFGADDLDIGPATSGTMTVGRVWIEKHLPIEAELTVDTAAGPKGAPASRSRSKTPGQGAWQWNRDPCRRQGARIQQGRGDRLALNRPDSSGLPPQEAPFTFQLEYTAPQTIRQEQF
jgi:hypothetical protein